MLKIRVDQLLEGPHLINVDVRPGELDLSDPVYRFEDRVRGELEFMLIGRDVLGRGKLTADVVADCVRCLDAARFRLEVPVEEMWLWRDREQERGAEPSADEIMAHFYESDEIDIGEGLRELILDKLPNYPYCSVDCKGLCAVCGTNLNHESCACPPKEKEEESGADWKSKLLSLKKEN